MGNYMPRGRTDGVMKKLAAARERCIPYSMAAHKLITEVLIQMAGAPPNPKSRKCMECGGPIDPMRYINGPRPLYCCRKCENRVSHRRTYARMKELNPAKYLARQEKRNINKKRQHAQRIRDGQCGTCGRINDNAPYRHTCERCLIKARREG
jgi:hypothetical protein